MRFFFYPHLCELKASTFSCFPKNLGYRFSKILERLSNCIAITDKNQESIVMALRK